MLAAVIRDILVTVAVLLGIGVVIAIPVTMALMRHLRRLRNQPHGVRLCIR